MPTRRAVRHSFTVLAVTAVLSGTLADVAEVLVFINRHRLQGKGIGYVDVHLLAAVALTQDAKLWTRDKHLRAAAQALGCSHDERGSH